MTLIEDIIHTNEFATLPSITSGILEMLDRDEVFIHELTKLIESDPALTMRLLRVANSPLYGVRGQIKTLRNAIMKMGFRRLTNIVLSVAIFSKFWLSTTKGAADIMDKFWYHSASTGTVAKSISAKSHQEYHGTEFIGGLLYQIGKLAMIQNDIPKYNKVIELVENEDATDYDAETNIFGFTHVDVGDKIAGEWKLPNILRVVIAHHLHPENLSENKNLVASISMAGVICEENGAGFYNGFHYENISDIIPWKILCDSFSIFREEGINLITADIEKQLKTSDEFLAALKMA